MRPPEVPASTFRVPLQKTFRSNNLFGPSRVPARPDVALVTSAHVVARRAQYQRDPNYNHPDRIAFFPSLSVTHAPAVLRAHLPRATLIPMPLNHLSLTAAPLPHPPHAPREKISPRRTKKSPDAPSPSKSTASSRFSAPPLLCCNISRLAGRFPSSPTARNPARTRPAISPPSHSPCSITFESNL